MADTADAVKPTELTELTIEPARWSRGCTSMLLEAGGKMCCLGFLAKACGYDDATILNQSTPGSLITNGLPNMFPESMIDGDKTSQFGIQAVVINDDVTLSEPERRQRLKLLFLENGIKLLFSDEKVTPSV